MGIVDNLVVGTHAFVVQIQIQNAFLGHANVGFAGVGGAENRNQRPGSPLELAELQFADDGLVVEGAGVVEVVVGLAGFDPALVFGARVGATVGGLDAIVGAEGLAVVGSKREPIKNDIFAEIIWFAVVVDASLNAAVVFGA